jgi:hypothetical protein
MQNQQRTSFKKMKETTTKQMFHTQRHAHAHEILTKIIEVNKKNEMFWNENEKSCCTATSEEQFRKKKIKENEKIEFLSSGF